MKMKMKNNLGSLFAIMGIVAALMLFYSLAASYNPVIDAHVLAGESDEGNSVRIVYAVLGWFGISAGALWAAVLYGFRKKESWAWYLGLIAATIQMLASFFPMIPAADGGMGTPTVGVFMIVGVLWFAMLLIGGVGKKIITLAFVSGLAYVLTFIDGVAPISKYQTSTGLWNGVYVMSQQINWWGSAVWAIFIFSILKRKSWSVPVGVAAATMSMIGGYPMGINNVIEAGRFSMFLPAPIIATILLVVILLPGTKRLIDTGGKEEV